MNYNTNKHKRAIQTGVILVIAAAVILAAYVVALNAAQAAAEDQLATCWILCKPGDYVNVRRTPGKNAMEVGRLEVGDSFLTDGVSSDGWIRCYGIGEYGEGWIYCGFVATEEPVAVFQTYVCAAPKRVACRRWMNGPKTRNPWLTNGSDVQVFHIAGEWACTSRGFIRAEWLDPNPQ